MMNSRSTLRNRTFLRSLAISGVIVSALIPSVYDDVIGWRGRINDDWGATQAEQGRPTETNWQHNIIPGASDDVVFQDSILIQ